MECGKPRISKGRLTAGDASEGVREIATIPQSLGDMGDVTCAKWTLFREPLGEDSSHGWQGLPIGQQ